MSATARTISVRRTPGVLLALGLGAGAVLGLAGCGQSGVAATVDGHDITVDQVQSAAKSLRAADPTDFAKATDRQILNVMIIGPTVERVVSAAGAGVSDDAVRQAILSGAQQAGTKGVDPSKLNQDALAALRSNIALNQLDATTGPEYQKAIASVKVKVSPRYGTFNAKTGNLTAATPNWIQKKSTPAATPAPSPSATG